jgi:predicted Abi (CAAX) family protease
MKKKALNNIFVFNSNGPQIEYIAKKNKQNTKKKKQSTRDPQINPRRSSYILKFSNIKKVLVRPDFKIKEK